MSILGLFGTPDVEKLKAKGNVKGLIKALEYEKDVAIRHRAAEALGQIGDVQAVEPLIAALKDVNVSMRQAATAALGQIGDAQAVEPLIAALKDVDANVRQSATGALVSIGAPAVDLLIAALLDRDRDMRGTVAGVLGRIGVPAMQSLIAALLGQDQSLRHAAAEALGRIGDTQTVEPLIAALKDMDASVRQAAVEALEQIGDVRAVEPLIATLKDMDASVRQAAVEALEQIGDVRAVEPLITVLKDTDMSVRQSAAEALDKFGWQPDANETRVVYWIAKGEWARCVENGASAVELLIAALRDKGWQVRQSAAEALGQIGDARAVGPLIATLNDTNQTACSAAVKALGKIGTPAVEPLIVALQDTGWQVRQFAAETLEQIGDARAVEPLIGVLKDAYLSVRQAAAKALEKIGAPAVEPLIAALQDADVRQIAIEALKKTGPSLEDAALRARVAEALDAALIPEIGRRGLAFFGQKGAAKEEDALRFRSLALEYLSHKSYVEAIAALGVASIIYAEIAPSFTSGLGIDHLLASGVDIDTLIQAAPDPGLRVRMATYKVLSSFDFEPDLKAISETSTKRQRAASLLRLLLTAQGQGAEAVAALAGASEGLKPLIRDETFVGACIDFLGKRATQEIQVLHTLALIPDIRTLPYLLKAFARLPFYPQGIDALVNLGENVHTQLLEALRTGNPNCRYNVALTLGVIEAEAARPIFTELLNTSTNPTERIGCCYGLVKLGESERLDEIVQALDHSSNDVRHAAAIALEHLVQPLADAVYVRHLSSTHALVRLRLTRKLGAQGTDNPALIEALIARFGDNEENVRSAAVNAVVKVGAEKVYDRMVELTRSRTVTICVCACQVLGKLADSRAEPLLLEVLQRRPSADIRKAVLSALADLQAVGTAAQIAKYLSDSNLSGPAVWALLRLGFVNREAVTKILQRHSDRPQRLFALTVLEDEGARQQFKAMLSPSTDIQALLQMCDYARILSNPDFESPLRNLLDYSNSIYAPTDKYIPYAAFKALVHTLLAKP